MPSNHEAQKKAQLDPKSLERLLARVYAHPEQKERLMNDLIQKGFCTTVSEYFTLNDHQKLELATIRERDCEAIVTDGVLAALRRNGKIEVNHEGHNPPNMRFNIGFGVDDGGHVSVHVGISC